MVKSMTGFGRSSYEDGGRSFTVEIKSVNHRFLDLNIRAPRSFNLLEDRIRKLIKEKIFRGKVDIFITQISYEKKDVIATFNETLCDSYISCFNKIRDKYNIRDDISVISVARFPEVISLIQEEEDIEKLWNSVKNPLNDSIDMLVSMREKEGEKLKEDIIMRCDYIKKQVDKIQMRAPQIIEEYRNKLTDKMKELLEDSQIDENRILLEAAIFSDKICIDEEIVRLNSHLYQVKETFLLNESIGRKLDFIIQEMNREANTIGSKANDIETVNSMLIIKNEIEKIREQVQNIE